MATTVEVQWGDGMVKVEAWLLRDPVPHRRMTVRPSRFETPEECAAAWVDRDNDFSNLSKIGVVVEGKAMWVCPYSMIAPVYEEMDRLLAERAV